MTLQELLEEIEDLLEAGVPEDAEVLLAFQPHWPLQFTLRAVVDSFELPTDEDDSGQQELDQKRYVYLAEGGHPYGASPYAPRTVFDR